ncbi:MAG: hypothetical protein JWQ28_1808 [Pedobacter sp.]|jgi:hypothetical protein|nr:hypothetical protein [Pedobacter sp.]
MVRKIISCGSAYTHLKTKNLSFGYLNMDPFNIKILIKDQPLTLTILPVDKELFKVVYFGSILGAVRKETNGAAWRGVPAEELTAGDLPFHQKDESNDNPNLELDAKTIEQIGQAIETELTNDLAS